MIIGAVLLVMIGGADLLRSQTALSRRARIASVIVFWSATLILAVTGLGVPLWWAVIPTVLSIGWVLSTSTNPAVRSPGRIAPAIGVLLAELAAIAADRAVPVPSGYLVDWHEGSVASPVPLVAVVMGVGCALFLIESANVIVRAALRPTVVESAEVAVAVAAPARSPRWWSKAVEAEPMAARLPDLRGGRLIGPLERLLIVALTLGGALPIVAGLLAAKGIVRFPEISNDAARGSKAEYFLVGSLVSWAVAIAAVGVIWISAHS